jgi:hypothetical protein
MTSRFSIVVVAAVALAIAGSGRVAYAQAIDLQVALSIDLLELSVGEWTERNAAAAGDGDEQAKAAATEAARRKYERLRAERYSSYGTSRPEHLEFFARHATEVQEYLADHPEIKGRIDALTETLRSLIAVGESAGSANAGAGQ